MQRFATERLTAERLREEHLADLVALHLDPDVSRYIGGVRSPEATSAYLATAMAHWDRHSFGLETSADDVQTSQVISLADWSDGTLTSLKPHAPEPTGTMVVFEEVKH